jgi:hypothetical protein
MASAIGLRQELPMQINNTLAGRVFMSPEVSHKRRGSSRKS